MAGGDIMKNTYQAFIQSILNTRGRFNCGDEYHECHHIVPRCMGGTDDKENLIDLFAREHFEAHRLLALENPDNQKLIHAWWMMSTTTKSDKRDGNITAEEYEEARKVFSKSMSGANNPIHKIQHPMLGIHLSEEQKQHLREINTGELSPKYGIPLSEETKAKISTALVGKTVTDQTRLNLRNAHLGKNMGADSSRAKQVAQYGLDGVLIKIWDCMVDIERKLNINVTSISRVCKNEAGTAGGYQFRYANGEVPDVIPQYIEQRGKYQIKTVARCDEDWNVIDVWEGFVAAQNGTGINRSHISSCCSGNRQHAGGYRWKILDENYE
jgi:hypothetical protein